MKQIRVVLFFSLISFISGFTLNSIRHNWLSHAETANASPSVTSPSSTPAPCPNQTQNTQDEFPRLIDDKYVTKFNGTKLNLDYGSWGGVEDIPSLIDSATILPLKSGGMFVDVGDTLYRLNDRYQVVWKHREAQWIFDYAFVEATNLIYGTAGDNVMFILDADTGKELHSDSRNGSAAYGVAQNYGNDMCLVTDNFVIYREKGRGANIEPMKDGITCLRGTKAQWHQDFPPDAQLAVNGNRILAVTKTKTGIYVQEISVPQRK